MENSKNVKRLSLGCVLCLLILLSGCCIYVGSCDMQAKYEKIVHLAMPLSPSSGFETQTHNGSITIHGADVADCNVTATIVARARTDERAMELADQTQVDFERMGQNLVLKIKRPEPLINCSVSVSLDCAVPNQVDLKLISHNGAVTLTNIKGRLDATTHNGKVTADQVTGAVKLQTHNGGISCKEISGDAQLETHNGGVDVDYSQTAEPVCDISVVTHNGSIDLTTPHNFSAQINVSTHNGSINTQMPITVTGTINRNTINGTIGAGQGKLFLETHNGSIKMR
jgi:hypothetical protein